MTRTDICGWVYNCRATDTLALVIQGGGFIGQICGDHAEELERRFEQVIQDHPLNNPLSAKEPSICPRCGYPRGQEAEGFSSCVSCGYAFEEETS